MCDMARFFMILIDVIDSPFVPQLRSMYLDLCSSQIRATAVSLTRILGRLSVSRKHLVGSLLCLWPPPFPYLEGTYSVLMSRARRRRKEMG